MNYYFTNTYNLFKTFTQTSHKPKNVCEPPSGANLVMSKMQMRAPKHMLFIEFPSGFQIKHTHARARARTHTHTHTEATFGSENSFVWIEHRPARGNTDVNKMAKYYIPM
jgi:hypothetical protein